MPRPSEAAREAFRSLVPKDPAVATRPMFGNLAAFVNGNMFTGLFGEDLFVRVSDDDRGRLLKEGGADFSPMPGRAMKGYVTLPAGWHKRSGATREWVTRSLDYARALPPKSPKPARPKRGA
jgi:TfoX/Sxy family transcriptional regulator of competence genes